MVNVTLQGDSLDPARLEVLKEIMQRHHGGCRSLLRIVLPDVCTAVLRLPESCNVVPTEALSLEVEHLLGYNAVSFE